MAAVVVTWLTLSHYLFPENPNAITQQQQNLLPLLLLLLAGVIDADYRGPVGVILFNWGDEDFVIKIGDRIAQLILESIVLPDICVVDDLSSTERGAGGFGSTGVSYGSDKKAAEQEEEEKKEGDDDNAVQSPKKQRTISPTAADGMQQDPPEKANSKRDPPTDPDAPKK